VASSAQPPPRRVGLLVRQYTGITRSGGRCARSAEGPNHLCSLHDLNPAQASGGGLPLAPGAQGYQGDAQPQRRDRERDSPRQRRQPGPQRRSSDDTGVSCLKGFVEVERRTKEQEEPEGRVAKLRRALEATESARGTEAIVKGPEIEIKGNYPTALVSGKASKDAEYLPNPNIRLQHRTART
jgi:hypothetical protein